MRDRRYFAGLSERFGFLPTTLRRTAPGAVWLHAVSVGEVMSAVALIRRLPGPVYVSVTTIAGREIAEKNLAGIAAGIFYVPLDYISCVRRVLRALRPALVLVLETEIWPNLFRESRRSGARLMIANGRISDRRADRYRSMAWFFSSVLQQPHALFVQTETDRDRYIATGASPELVELGGNLKYDFTPLEHVAPEIQGLIQRAEPSAVWIAASTMPPLEDGDVDEDDAVVDAFLELRERHPRLLLILVPRRPERFDSAAEKLRAARVPFVRRSFLRLDAQLDLPGVLLLDTVGELAGLFSIADVVFMGGTLARRGGHNILEPAFFAKPIVIGPNMQNFSEIARQFREQSAVIEIDSAAGLAAGVERVLTGDASAVGQRARDISFQNRGAVEKISMDATVQWEQSLSQPIPSLWRRVLLGPIAAAWRVGAR
ncbi:MAG: glycosyltransferase N-terminal domain-containing protein [Bryobacteraceae bacterium]